MLFTLVLALLYFTELVTVSGRNHASQFPPPPPPPPPPHPYEEAPPNKKLPIDYQFPAMQTQNIRSGPETYTSDGIPQTGDDDRSYYNKPTSSSSRKLNPPPEFASARKDAISRYTSASKLGKIKLGLASSSVGAALGGFVGYSLLSSSGGGSTFALILGFVFWVTSHVRNSYGEMCRSLGLALIYLMRRTKVVRKRYKTGPHVKGMCRLGKRQPFPPILGKEEDENPWRYSPLDENDPEFEMIKSLLCMAFVGSFCGGSVPLIPTWMGSAGGAALFAFLGIAKNSRGDLVRTMGMRIVALLGEAIDINSELRVAKKVGVVGSKILDKMLILDRKHRIKDKIFSSASWAYDKVSSTASKVQEDMQEKKQDENLSEDQYD